MVVQDNAYVYQEMFYTFSGLPVVPCGDGRAKRSICVNSNFEPPRLLSIQSVNLRHHVYNRLRGLKFVHEVWDL